MRVAVVGATGAVGSTMLGVMRERSFPADEVVAFASERSVEELHDQTRALIEADEMPAPQVFPHQIAGNVLPQAGSFPPDSDYTDEELKLVNETRKILEAPDIGVSATCTRVPVYTSHSESVNVQTRDPLSPEECRELLAGFPGITLLDDPADGVYPLAIDAAGRDDVLVGRIRRDPSHERCLNLWIVSGNLRKGAATN